MFELVDTIPKNADIKVVGVGGGALRGGRRPVPFRRDTVGGAERMRREGARAVDGSLVTGDWADSSTLAAGALDAFFSVRLGWLPTCFSVPRRPREASKRSTRAAEDGSGAHRSGRAARNGACILIRGCPPRVFMGARWAQKIASSR